MRVMLYQAATSATAHALGEVGSAAATRTTAQARSRQRSAAIASFMTRLSYQRN